MFLVIIGLQVVLPAYKLTEPRPARFGWQMYSGGLESARFSVRVGNDSVLPIDKQDVTVNARADMVYQPLLVPHLCRSVAGATAVLVEGRDFPDGEVHACE